jgi:hypothetical protein
MGSDHTLDNEAGETLAQRAAPGRAMRPHAAGADEGGEITMPTPLRSDVQIGGALAARAFASGAVAADVAADHGGPLPVAHSHIDVTGMNPKERHAAVVMDASRDRLVELANTLDHTPKVDPLVSASVHQALSDLNDGKVSFGEHFERVAGSGAPFTRSTTLNALNRIGQGGKLEINLAELDGKSDAEQADYSVWRLVHEAAHTVLKGKHNEPDPAGWAFKESQSTIRDESHVRWIVDNAFASDMKARDPKATGEQVAVAAEHEGMWDFRKTMAAGTVDKAFTSFLKTHSPYTTRTGDPEPSTSEIEFVLRDGVPSAKLPGKAEQHDGFWRIVEPAAQAHGHP